MYQGMDHYIYCEYRPYSLSSQYLIHIQDDIQNMDLLDIQEDMYRLLQYTEYLHHMVKGYTDHLVLVGLL